MTKFSNNYFGGKRKEKLSKRLKLRENITVVLLFGIMIMMILHHEQMIHAKDTCLNLLGL